MNVTPAVDSDSSCASTVSIGGTDDGFQDTEDDDLEEEDSDCDELLDTSDASPSDPDDSGPQIDIDSASIAYWLLTHAAHHLRGHLVYPLNERTNRLETLFRFDTDTDADEPVACEDHPVWSTRLFYDAVGVRDVEFTGGDPDGEWCVFLHEGSVRRRLRGPLVLVELGLPCGLMGVVGGSGDGSRLAEGV